MEINKMLDRQSTEKSAGFTIVELMIALLLGLLIAGAIITIFVENRRSFDRDEIVMQLQDDGRQAIREVSRDISMAGFWSDLVLPSAIFQDGSLSVVTDCGPAGIANWIYQPVTAGTNQSEAITMIDNTTGAEAAAAYSCIPSAEVVPGTDIVAIKRLAGAQSMAATANTAYLRSNGTFGLLYVEPADTPPAVDIPAPFWEWEYRPSIYYIRNFAVTAGDGIPTLCRKVIQYGGAPTMVTECIAQGIENLQIEYGLDTDSDGEPNEYDPDPTLAELQTAVAARIYILARSAEADVRYENDKTYRISNAPAYTPDDNFYRRVYSITVGIRNLAALQSLRS